MEMATPHTPGPWHTGAGNGEGSIFAENGRMRAGHDSTELYPICKMGTVYEKHEDAANARLIATAPTLLAALQNILWKLDRNEVKGGDTATLPAMIDRNDAVIRDARELINDHL